MMDDPVFINYRHQLVSMINFLISLRIILHLVRNKRWINQLLFHTVWENC